MTTVEQSIRFDLTDPRLLADPYPAFARLRAAGGLATAGPGQWVVSRHADITALLRDSRLEKNFPEEYYRFSVGGDPELSGFLAGMNLGHRNRLASRVLVKALRPGLVRQLEDHMVQLIDELLEPAAQRGHLDIVDDLALPFPMMVICELLGIPPAERSEVWPRAATLVAAFSDVAFQAEKDVAAAVEALRWLRAYLGDRLRARDGDDLLSRMRDTEDGGERLTGAEIVDNAITVFYAGFETSMGVVSNGVVELLRHPDQLARLRADPGLVPSALEEILRYEAPIQVTMRSPTEPLTIAGHRIRPGRVLYLLLGSANRDEERFDAPDRFDVGRDPNPHLSFGGGLFHCLGAALARAEGRAVLNRILARHIEFAFDSEPVRRPRFNFRSYERIPVTIRMG